ncbi:ROK family protein [Thermocrinis albus DSM 14484]|uniref:ROK family protein n=1 Tax=Thermocrinis albus (strain DSM 14484 / JCM 11386 / HI 11/12) TaxID=638303 RepID=D3SNI3_THEAH|nr:ROK family protein [Thermocrinis albus]ADC88720.1 ROK family protein [Thermocrinis albus DSM 14484]
MALRRIKGVDIGGTFVKVVHHDGRREKFYVHHLVTDREAFLREIKRIVDDGRPEVVGVAVAGFTSTHGVVDRSPNIPALDGVNLREFLEEDGRKVIVMNDVTAGAYGEWFYHHTDSKVLLLVAIGTGLGAGLVIDGRPFLGACGSALELGHHILEKDGQQCHCGRRGCWEAYCSSYGLENIYRRLTGEHLHHTEIVKVALQGEEKALESVQIMLDYMVTGIMNALHLFNPDRVVLAGGMVEALKPWLGNLEEEVRKRAEKLPANCFSLHFSSEGEFCMALGALALAQDHI